ncbi:hypothetical protein LB504_005027 [Fusarium proliferatum]|nr:hypothetical protein LB504_005027 [Fusarium proliferatum]
MDSPGQSCEYLSILNRLPLEILNQVIYTLPNADIKNLRLTCSYLGNISLPRFNRVFISTNLRDIEVFTLIANHDVFRFKVTEIIYNDLRFGPTWRKQFRRYHRNADDPAMPYWYRRFCRSIVNVIDTNEEEHRDTPHNKETFEAHCALAESYKLFDKLRSQQDEVSASGRDADALRYGLLSFPNLKRVTLCPSAHGILGRPLYPTPTIRSLPQDLISPLERGLHLPIALEEHPLTPWNESSTQKWRGFCVITKEIAEYIRKNPAFGLSEFVVESRQLSTGINCRLFDNPASDEYHDLVTILSHPRLIRFELSLACSTESRQNWPSFRSGLLSRALSKAKNLQSIRFYTSVPFVSRKWHDFVDGEQNGMPLRSIFPINDWCNLRHFALSRSFVKQRDVMAFISTLPTSLESLELSFLSFLPREGTYRDLLQGMRCNSGWRERLVRCQPKLIVFVVETETATDGAAVDVSRAVMDYMYNHGENPFVEDQIMEILEGKGTEVDLLDPVYDGELHYDKITSVYPSYAYGPPKPR